MNNLRVVILLIFTLITVQTNGQQVDSYITNDTSFQDNMNWMRNYTKGLVESNRGKLDNGTTVFFAGKCIIYANTGTNNPPPDHSRL